MAIGPVDGLSIWERVEKSDPNTLKKMKHGPRLTAIDAYSQIKKATEIFGPVGLMWGWEPIWTWHESLGYVSCQATFWYHVQDHANRCQFDVVGTHALRDKYDKPILDAPKSALTDAVTKALSYLGFNADVFMGTFDGTKYEDPPRQYGHSDAFIEPKHVGKNSEVVHQTHANTTDGDSQSTHPAQRTLERITKEIDNSETMDELIMLWEANTTVIGAMPGDMRNAIKLAKDNRKAEIQRGSVHN